MRFQKMSEGNDKDTNTAMFCASCGTPGSDDTKLKKCNACYLVRYCGVKCQRNHWPKHKKECKRRAAELKDELLFKQPDSTHNGDCPLCCLPLPIDPKKSNLYPCCSKLVCIGCNLANQKREAKGRHQVKCPFCREAGSKTEEEKFEQLMKRIEANDPVAMCFMATQRYHGGDFKAAFEYWTKAAALGDAEAHYQLSVLYLEGKGVGKDEKKQRYHLEQAAIEGNPMARQNLGVMEARNGRVDRAARHFIIAAKQGYDSGLECVKTGHQAGLMSKEDLVAALRGHKAAVDATKSPQREEAYEFYEFVGKEIRSGKV